MMPDRSADLLFYDGGCGLCHRSVIFVLARDREGAKFRYAPLGGSTFVQRFSEGERVALPDSIVLHTSDGQTLVRSAALIHVGERLGGPWRMLARIASRVPRWLLDLGYDGVARIRRRLFTRPEGVCPRLPPELGTRFLP
jgi:predicted DCC family thiol-disulfide oxidoreductase YuxK